MSFVSVGTSIFAFIFSSLKEWLYIFISPIENLNILWIIIPIWFSWFFAEFFQEKRGTSFGNAISNGVVPVFVALDWTRYLTQTVVTNKLPFSWGLFSQYFLCLIVMLYGVAIIYFGIKGRKFIQYFGRIRAVTYVLVVFSPIVYGILPLSWKFVLLVLVFFPVFYYLIEFIDLFTPDPSVFKEDNEQSNNKSKSSTDDFKSDFNFDAPSQNTDSYNNNNANNKVNDFNFNSISQNNNNNNYNNNSNNSNTDDFNKKFKF